MGLLDPTLLGNLNKLKGLLGETPIGKYVRGQDQGVSVNGLKQALLGMPVFDQRAGEQDMAYAADAIGPQAIGMLGKIVYHGSPHKFDKFDASKIGTGEGAQAYGHGVYLADSPKVAEGYAKDLGTAVTVDGHPILQNNKAKWDSGLSAGLTDALIANYGDTAAARKMLLESARDVRSSAGQPWYDKRNLREYQKEMAELRRVRGKVSVDNTGSLYKADLPDEWIPKMLDWDKPLSKQPGISGLLKMRVIKETEPSDSKFLVEFSNGVQTGFRTKREAQAFVETATGGDVIQHMSPTRGTQYTKDLSALGIPGIRYLDGGSRGKGQGSYNYVVFPGLEDQVKILERNGTPINDGLLGRK